MSFSESQSWKISRNYFYEVYEIMFKKIYPKFPSYFFIVLQEYFLTKSFQDFVRDFFKDSFEIFYGGISRARCPSSAYLAIL